MVVDCGRVNMVDDWLDWLGWLEVGGVVRLLPLLLVLVVFPPRLSVSWWSYNRRTSSYVMAWACEESEKGREYNIQQVHKWHTEKVATMKFHYEVPTMKCRHQPYNTQMEHRKGGHSEKVLTMSPCNDTLPFSYCRISSAGRSRGRRGRR